MSAVALSLVTSARGELVRPPDQRGALRVWDTMSPLADRIDIRNTDGWTAVFPVAEGGYTPRGDLVIQNRYLAAVISAKQNRVVYYSLPSGTQRISLMPLGLKSATQDVVSLKVVGGPDDRAVVHVGFAGAGRNSSVVLSFDKTPVVTADPSGGIQGFNLKSSIEYVVAPSFVGDDLLIDARRFGPDETPRITTDNMLVGLLAGGDGMLVAAWAEGTRAVTPILTVDRAKSSVFRSVQIESGVDPFHFAVLDAPDIWHREKLEPSYLEKDVVSDWERPFDARWKTQLSEDKVKTTYRFGSARRKRFWRGGVGTYTYPVWTHGDSTFYRLGKKVPPKAESVVYYLERTGDTPDSVLAPADIAKQVLSTKAYDALLDFSGRKKTQDGRPDHCVGTATCGVTDKFKPIFEAGNETDEMETIEGGIEDMVYHLNVLTERVHVYQGFAHETLAYLTALKRTGAAPSPYTEEMEAITLEFIAAYGAQKENIRDLAYARELGRETHTLAEEKGPDNLAAFLKLKGRWTGMGGALEGLNRKLNTIARKLHQQAGYASATRPETIGLALELRRRVRELLRNPNGYEIWAYD